MCNSVIHEDGVRCPSDTSEARRLRRHNMKLKTRYGAAVTAPTAPNLLVTPVVEVVENVEEHIPADEKLLTSIHSDQEALDVAFQSTNPDLKLIDELTNRMGASVETLSEIKYGAPTEEQILVAHNEYEEKKLATIKKLEQEEDNLRSTIANLGFEHVDEFPDSNKMFPVTSIRFWERIKDLDPVRSANGVALAEKLRDLQIEQGNIRRGTNNAPEPSIELLKKRNMALQAALKDAGVVFSDPDSIRVSSDSAPKAMKALKEALAFVPQAWVDNSNVKHDGKVELRIKNTKGRAHYNSFKGQKGRKTTSVAYTHVNTLSWEPSVSELSRGKWTKTDGSKTWVDPLDSNISYSITSARDTSVAVWIEQPYEFRSTKPAKGSSEWEECQEPVMRYEKKENASWGEHVPTGETVTKWRKPRTRSRLVVDVYKSEITVDESNGGVVGHKNPGTRVALHEFSHRAEDTTPRIRKLESAFLQRRIGTFDNNVETGKIAPLPGLKGEYAYKDNFVEHYMGKTYSNGSGEILSMGMETLWSGTQGGFSGLNGFAPDSDMKRSILGIMVATGK